MTSIISNNRRDTPPPRFTSQSPIPRARSVLEPPANARGSRISPLSRPRTDTLISGSETERDEPSTSSSKADGPDDYYNVRPSTSSNFRSGTEQHDVSEAGERFNSMSRASSKRSPSHVSTASISGGSISRRRGGSILDRASGDTSAAASRTMFADAVAAAVNDPPSIRTSPQQTRKALPREFRDRPRLEERVNHIQTA